ncbi:MAG: S-layer homology domain-containing protein [Clostridia bacterium]
MYKFKKIVAISLTLATLLGTQTFAFNDITDTLVESSANTLSSLGIINGVGNDNFEPNGNITRAQFAKIAVLTLGGTNSSNYKNFTIFPDVPHTHWASAYVNMSVKEYGIIKGLPDGTFNPEGNIKFSEAIAMMLYMLDYEIADIGPFWPTDFVDKADELGITDGVNFSNADAEYVTRGDAAIMITNLLQTETKEGQLLIESAFPYTDTDCMLLATSATDSTLNDNQARVYIGGSEVIKTYNLPNINYGASGTFVYEDSSKSKITSFIQDGSSEIFVLKNVYIDKIVTVDEEIYIPSTTTLIIDGEISTYGESWLDIFKGSEISINYDTLGNISSITANNIISNSFLYDGTQSLSGFDIYKNGVKISVSDINKNDVVMISNDRAYVSDITVTGFYESATPSVFYPNEITILGSDFNIPEHVRAQFSSLNLQDVITLFFDSNGNIAFVQNGIAKTQTAYLNSFDGTQISITIDNLLTTTLTIDPDDSSYFTSSFEELSSIYKYIGKFVDLTFSSRDKIKITENADFSYVSQDYDVKNATIGTEKVASNVQIFEGLSSSSAYSPIDFSDITLDVIPAKNIISCAKNSDGLIDKIILTNVTGNNLDYGLATSYQEEIEYYNSITDKMSSYKSNSFKLTTASSTLNYPSINYSRMYSVPVGIQKGLSDKPYKQFVAYTELEKVATVDTDAFFGSKYIKTDDILYNISEEVVVFDDKNDRFVELNYARQNFTSFELFMDNSLQNPMIRVIIVE